MTKFTECKVCRAVARITVGEASTLVSCSVCGAVALKTATLESTVNRVTMRDMVRAKGLPRIVSAQ